MDDALYRSYNAVPITSFDELRTWPSQTAVYVGSDGCEHCAALETEHWDDAIAGLRRIGVAHLATFKCHDAATREVAIAVGVDDVPAFVVVNGRDTRIIPGNELVSHAF